MNVKGFSTKYALTQGIAAVSVEREDGSKYVYGRSNGYQSQYIVGVTFFESREDAIENAKQQAARKARSMRKRLAKIDRLAETPMWAPTSASQPSKGSKP